MKKLLLLTLFVGLFFSLAAQTTIIGGAGTIAGRNNPNALSALDFQDARYEGLTFVDTLTGTRYNYNNTLSAGSRWVVALTTEVDGSVTNEGSLTVGAGTGTTSLINSNTSGSTPVTIEAAGINTIAEVGNTITITATEVDGSVTNEGSLTVAAGTSTTSIINSNTSGQTGVTLTAAGALSIAETGNVITLTATEVDGSVSNEGIIGVGAGGANTSVITSNTSTAAGVTVDGGTNKGISITESTSANGGTVTVALGALAAYANDAAAATGGLAVGDWYKASADNTMGMAAGTPKIRAY